MIVSVILPTHNPHPVRLARTLAALSAQTLPAENWECLLVDNASSPPVETAALPNFRVVREPQLGLTAARRRGLHEAKTPFVVFVDDDNALGPDYLTRVLTLFAAHPRLGLAGGKSLPQFDSEPPAWTREFFPLLALRDLGDEEIISSGFRPDGVGRREYPSSAPIGAGMAARVAALQTWADRDIALSDRRGADLSSAGDNDIVLCALRAGWDVGYFPQLHLSHMIPAARLETAYLARLNRGIQKSWMQVLSLHDANPWPPIAPWSARLRQLKAYFSQQGWSRPSGYIRWQGACGHFAGRATTFR